MKRLKLAVIVALCALIALAPSLAEARAGNGRSAGSRGSYGTVQRYSQPPAAQIQPRAAQPSYRPAPARPVPGPTPGFGAVHPFWSGLMGGLVGAGIGGLLFGHGAWPVGVSPVGAGIGLLLQLVILGLLGWGAMRLLRRRV